MTGGMQQWLRVVALVYAVFASPLTLRGLSAPPFQSSRGFLAEKERLVRSLESKADADDRLVVERLAAEKRSMAVAAARAVASVEAVGIRQMQQEALVRANATASDDALANAMADPMVLLANEALHETAALESHLNRTLRTWELHPPAAPAVAVVLAVTMSGCTKGRRSLTLSGHAHHMNLSSGTDTATAAIAQARAFAVSKRLPDDQGATMAELAAEVVQLCSGPAPQRPHAPDV